MTQKEGFDVVSGVTSNILAEPPPRLSSLEVQDILQEREVKGRGKVTVYGEHGKTGAQRTEIEVPSGRVVVHSNYSPFSSVARFSGIDVVSGEKTHSLTITSLGISPTDPLLDFYEGGKPISNLPGYGRTLNLQIASVLLEESLATSRGSLPISVVTWIRAKLENPPPHLV